MSFFLRLPTEALFVLNLLLVIACSLTFSVRVSVIPAVSEALYLSSHRQLLILTDLQDGQQLFLQTGVSLTWKANIISWHQSNRLVLLIFWCIIKKKLQLSQETEHRFYLPVVNIARSFATFNYFIKEKQLLRKQQSPSYPCKATTGNILKQTRIFQLWLSLLQ